MEKLTPNQCSSKEYFDIHHKKKNISWRQNTMQSCRGILKTLNSDMRKHKILDMGCGSGEFVKVCQEKGADNVVGVDISQTTQWENPAMIWYAPSAVATRG